MTLLHFDGFDVGEYASTYGGSAVYNVFSTTRFSQGRSMNITSDAAAKTFTASSEVFVGFAMSASQGSTSTGSFLALWGDSGATLHLNLVWDSASSLSVKRGSTTLASATVSQPVSSFGAWLFIEVSATLHDSTGHVVVKVDGATVIDFTGDTKNGGTASTIDKITFGKLPTAGFNTNVAFDDLYICNSAGSSPHNTFLGPVRVHTLSPSGAGTDTNMTPSAGSNYQCVDEQPYSATDYVTGSTGQRDTYAMANPSSPGTIFAVQPTAVIKKTDAGALSAKMALRSGGTVYYGSDVALSSSDGTIRDLRTVDPATGVAWTSSGVNAAEAGVEVV